MVLCIFKCSVLRDLGVKIAQKDVYVKQGKFFPMGDQMDEYWKRYANNFPKLAQISSVLRLWPTTSTSLERSFSQISARYNKRGNRIICETLCNLHNSGRASREFIVALKNTCQDLGISYE